MPNAKPGFVYVLFNPAFTGLVKIGRTCGASEARAEQMSRVSGLPLPFIVAHDEFVPDCAAAERALHRRLAEHRVSEKREFFEMPLKDAVRALCDVAVEHRARGNVRGFAGKSRALAPRRRDRC